MRLILRTDVEQLGKRGEVVKVTPGYARNFLVPKGMAYEFSEGNLKRFEKERKVLEVRQVKEQQEAQALAGRLAKVSCTIVKKVGDSDTLYGAVTNADVAEALTKEGFSIDKRRIVLDDPIKTLGIYTVPIRIHPEVTAELKVWVVKE